ncbi:MAG: hypothetical protein GXP31_01580 [Kiritimatiellaeota bacterium]|nr:hypothetical protein [Kiritimatiellota bacterium]
MTVLVLFVVSLTASVQTPAAPPLPSIENIVARKISLSYTDPKRCLLMLQTFGYATGEAGKPVDPKRLPYIIESPSTKNYDLPNAKNQKFPLTETDPIHELVVFFDRNRPEQFGAVQERIRETIDVPARQIMIEAMVLEISSGALADLGVQWDLDRSTLKSDANWLKEHTTGTLRVGNVVLPDGNAIANATLDATFSDVFKHFEVQLRALIIAKKAKVLSRPSVLTLDNRMAYINVSEEIPVAESRFLANGNVSQVSFKKETAGIELTVRPRVNVFGTEIGMQIAAAVTAEIPGEEEIVKDFNGNVVATSPRISVRRVQTYARIANNTPFIIGGLIAADDKEAARKVPVLGDIPLIGGLFRTRATDHGKREVIIVITPHVLPNERAIAGALPKDEDSFDNFGNQLFRNAYRIRSEDVFDLAFLTENREIIRFQQVADKIVTDNYALAAAYPINHFAGGRIPGEDILVCRQIYEVIKRKKLDRDLDIERTIYFEPRKDKEAGFGVDFLVRRLKALADRDPAFPVLTETPSPVRKVLAPRNADRNPTEALVLTFEPHRESAQASDLMREPVPELKVVECPDEQTWGKMLWELNQPTADGAARYTIILRTPEDLTRLKRAILLKRTVALNARDRELTLKNFSLGHILQLPTVKPDQVFLIDAEVARYFFYTEQYYPAVQKVLEKAIQAFQKLLKEPAFAKYAPSVADAHSEPPVGEAEAK